MTQNAEYVCRYCGQPVSIRESGEWGHTRLVLGRPRFWCGPGYKWERVEPLAHNGSSETP